MMIVREIDDSDANLWNEFVNSSNLSCYSHLYEWKKVLENSYRLNTKFLGALEEGKIISVLPTAIINYPLKGKYAVSLPYLNSAGILYEEWMDREKITSFYIDWLLKKGIKSFEERRGETKTSSHTEEYTLVLKLEEDPESIWKGLDAKVRNQIRKGIKSNLQSFVGKNQLDEFYNIYARNISALGTPVHSKEFFSNILEQFGDKTEILTVKVNGKTAAAMLFFKYKQIMSDLWASSLKEYQDLCPNMFMYWEAIRYGSSNHFEIFDFGRSRINSGTYKFKKQWGAEPSKIFNLSYYKGTPQEKSSVQNYRGKKARFFAEIWRNIPFPIAKFLGPKFRKYIP